MPVSKHPDKHTATPPTPEQIAAQRELDESFRNTRFFIGILHENGKILDAVRKPESEPQESE